MEKAGAGVGAAYRTYPYTSAPKDGDADHALYCKRRNGRCERTIQAGYQQKQTDQRGLAKNPVVSYFSTRR